MLIYYAVAATASALAWLSEKANAQARPDDTERRARQWNYFDYVAVTILVGFAGLREGIGTDYTLYTSLFRAITVNDWGYSLDNSPQEYGFTLLMLTMKSASPEPVWVFLVCSVITVLLVYATIKQHSTSPSFTLLLYAFLALYVAPFNTVRQGVAAAILFFASRYIGHRWVRWMVAVALATSMHGTALLVAVIQLVARRWRPRLSTFTVIIVATFAFKTVFLGGDRLSGLLSAINPRYAEYLQEGDQGGLGTYLIAIVLTALVAYCIYRSGDEDPEESRERQAWLSYAALAPLFLILGSSVVSIGRMYEYFALYLLLLLPAATARARQPGLDRFAIVACSAVYFGFYLNSFGDLLPYDWVL